jgi:MFS superfamily sulfate permease-like transporter
VLLATFLLTVFRDLTEAIAVGVVLGSLVFMAPHANALWRAKSAPWR